MIGFYVLVGFLILVVAGCCAFWFFCVESVVSKAISVIVDIVLIIGIIFGSQFYLTTAGGLRMQKSWTSEVNNGIERTVTIYDINGKEIKQYAGKFDVDYDSSRIIFDDEKGKRHVIYYTTGTVTIDER